MSFIDIMKNRAKENKKRIVLPETMDRRVMEAASIVLEEEIADIILIGNNEEIVKNGEGFNLVNAAVIDPANNQMTEKLIQQLYDLRKDKGMTIEEARRLLLEDYMYYACMLVKSGLADGVVSGACHSTANTLRPALQIIKTKPGTKLVSTFMLMDVPNCEYGSKGTFIFADCGLEQNPNAEKLVEIAVSSADSFKKLLRDEPIVAMLSHSTLGSAVHDDVTKVVEAVNIAKKDYPQYKIDGELQLDAAIIPEVAVLKAPNSEVAGKANVLIFPDLDAGNIGYKLVQRLSKAEAYGPITQGIAAPINDLSRGCSVEDIVGAVAITAVQADK
jgi:phosphate acetyltransferase